MNVDNLTQMFQTGFRVTLGAASSLVEILQDSQKRIENFDKIQSQWNEFTEQWAAKGEVTEQEARKFVDTLIHQQSGDFTNSPETRETTVQVTTPDPPAASNTATVSEIQELTEDIAALRTELEGLQASDSKK